jgi:hypothetical protein
MRAGVAVRAVLLQLAMRAPFSSHHHCVPAMRARLDPRGRYRVMARCAANNECFRFRFFYPRPGVFVRQSEQRALGDGDRRVDRARWRAGPPRGDEISARARRLPASAARETLRAAPRTTVAAKRPRR